MPSPSSFALHALDGYALAAQDFAPDTAPRAHALIAPAMGVAQRYYAPFALWLASRGIHVTTFDYRGIGRSRHGALRSLDANIINWARDDAGAALAHVRARAGSAPLYWIGHSLGGQILPFVPGAERITRVVTVATGSGYWRENSPGFRWLAPWLWYIVTPLALRLAGYFPGKRLKKVGDLPYGVMEQWRRWCLHPEYAIAEGEHVRAQFAAVRTPITSLSFTDDEYMSAENIASIHGFYSGAERQMLRIAPADVGVERIGHFGFFRERFQASLWDTHLLPALA
jgi:predicted alpha/beta hydrolase